MDLDWNTLNSDFVLDTYIQIFRCRYLNLEKFVSNEIGFIVVDLYVVTLQLTFLQTSQIWMLDQVTLDLTAQDGSQWILLDLAAWRSTFYYKCFHIQILRQEKNINLFQETQTRQ